VVAILSLVSSGARARGKPPSGTPATLTFEDLVDDAIQSDGYGSYSGSIESGVLTLSTGKKRSIYFDFSNCYPGYSGCRSPFESSTDGLVSNVTVTVWLDDFTGSGYGTAGFEFNLSGEKFELAVVGLEVLEFDEDGDGSIDRYGVASTDATQATLSSVVERGFRGKYTGEYYFEVFEMPWGAEVTVD
jgi:hypothetical protein